MRVAGLIIDSREPTAVTKTFDAFNVPVGVMALDSGDVLVYRDDGSQVIFERKTPTDFLNSLRSGRIFNQAGGMLSVTRNAYVVVTGIFMPTNDSTVIAGGFPTDWSWHSLSGALEQLQEMGIVIVYTLNDNEYPFTVMRIGAKPHNTVRTKPVRNVEAISTAEIILTSLPGIGMDKARKLIEHCGNAANAIDYLTNADYNVSVPGIGRGIRDNVRAALGLADGHSLVVYENEVGFEEECQKIETTVTA